MTIAARTGSSVGAGDSGQSGDSGDSVGAGVSGASGVGDGSTDGLGNSGAGVDWIGVAAGAGSGSGVGVGSGSAPAWARAWGPGSARVSGSESVRAWESGSVPASGSASAPAWASGSGLGRASGSASGSGRRRGRCGRRGRRRRGCRRRCRRRARARDPLDDIGAVRPLRGAYGLGAQLARSCDAAADRVRSLDGPDVADRAPAGLARVAREVRAVARGSRVVHASGLEPEADVAVGTGAGGEVALSVVDAWQSGCGSRPGEGWRTPPGRPRSWPARPQASARRRPRFDRAAMRW